MHDEQNIPATRTPTLNAEKRKRKRKEKALRQ
jgi:hypothetical protein